MPIGEGNGFSKKSSFTQKHVLLQKGACGFRVAALREIALGGLEVIHGPYHRHVCPEDFWFFLYYSTRSRQMKCLPWP